MQISKFIRQVAVVSLLMLFIMPVQAQNNERAIRVGSELFAESEILAQMMIIMLQDAGFTVEDNTAFGGTFENRNALEDGIIDVYPEYTGTAYANFNLEARDEIALDGIVNPLQIYVTVATLDAANHDLIWLQPAPASNAYALTVTKEFSEANDITTMSEFAAYVNDGGVVKLATNEEFAQFSDGLPYFETLYNFDITGEQMIVVIGATPAQTEDALARGVNGINVAMAFATDGTISALDLVVLEDDLEVFLPYQPAPVFNGELIRDNPEIVTILNPVFASLSAPVVRGLNLQVQVLGETPYDVALSYLEAAGFLGDEETEAENSD